MRQNKFLVIVVIILLLLNISTLGFLFFNMHKPPHDIQGGTGTPRDGGPPPISIRLKEPLKLTEEQTLRLDSMHRTYVTEMAILDKDFHDALSNYFNLLIQNSYTQEQKDSLLNDVLKIHAQKVSSAFMNFENIEKFLTPDQNKKFKEMLPSILSRVIDGGGRQRPANGGPGGGPPDEQNGPPPHN